MITFPRVDVPEYIDRDDQPVDEYVGAMHNIVRLNRTFRGYAGLLAILDRHLPDFRGRNLFITDVGTGVADIPLLLSDWARRHELRVNILGLDRNPDVVRAAAELTHDCPDIRIEQRDIFENLLPPDSTDLVLCSQFLHHFPPDAAAALLKQFSLAARIGVIASDLVRHPAAYYGIRIWTTLFMRNRITRNDAPASIRRSYTVKEWNQIASVIGDARVWNVRAVYPWRIALDNLPPVEGSAP